MNAPDRTPKDPCPRCGTLLPAIGPCPACLLRSAIGSSGEIGDPLQFDDLELPGTHIQYFGDYELGRMLGRGGMGIVNEARQVNLNRRVAIKRMLAGPLAAPEVRDRFRLEAEASARLSHPNIVAIYETGEHSGQPYYAMEFIVGQTLAEIIHDVPLPPTRAARYLRMVAEAVHYAHQQGVLHRDLKPQNILIDSNDSPRVTDFGLAQLLDDDRHLTQTAETLGAPAYMPPEQARFHKPSIGAASDVYSLGATLYHALTGRPPFQAPSLAEVIEQLLRIDPISPRILNPRIPRDLETICMACLEKDPAKRYPSAKALADDLGHYLANEPIRRKPATVAMRVMKWCRRKPAHALAAGLTLAFAAKLGTESIHGRNERYRLHLELAGNAFERDEPGEALLELRQARLLKPEGPLVQARLNSTLAHRAFPIPALPLMHHNGAVSSARISADQHWIATGSSDSRVRLWSFTNQSKPAFEWTTSNTVASLAFHPTRNLMLATDKSGLTDLFEWTNQIWLRRWSTRLPASSLVSTLTGDPPVAILPDVDGNVSFIPAASGIPITVNAHAATIGAIALGSSGKLAATADDSGIAIVWDTATQTPLIAALLSRSQIRSLTFADNDRLLVTGSSNAVFWSLPHLDPVQEWKLGAPISTLCVSPDQKSVIAGTGDGSVRGWSVSEMHEVLWKSPMQHHALVSSIAVSLDGRFGISAGADRTARLFSLADGRLPMDPIHHSGPLSSATFSPDGQYILTSSWDGIASLWTLPVQIPGTMWQDHGKGPQTHTEAFSANCLAVDSTETLLVSGSEAGTVIFSSTVKPGIIRVGPTNQDGANLTGQYDFKIPIQTIAWRRSTTQVGLTLVDVESTPPRGSAALMDASTRSLLWRSEVHQGIPWFGEFSPDGLGFVSVADDSTAVYINSQDGSVQNRLDLGRREPELTRFTDALGKCAMHPLDCQIALPARNNRIYLWSPRKRGSSAVEEWRLRLPALAAAWSPDGSRLGIGMESGGWEIRKSASGEILNSGNVQSDIRRVTFSSDGELMALGGEDGTVTVVRLDQTRPLAVFKSMHKGVMNLQFLSDSKFILASSRGGEMALWALAPPILANELFHFPSAVDRLALCESKDCVFATCRDGVVRRIQLERGKKSLPEPLEDWLLRLFTGDLPAVEELILRLHPSQQTYLSELLIRKK